MSDLLIFSFLKENTLDSNVGESSENLEASMFFYAQVLFTDPLHYRINCGVIQGFLALKKAVTTPVKK